MMLEQNEEWSLNRRYMQLEGLQTLSDTVPTRLNAKGLPAIQHRYRHRVPRLIVEVNLKRKGEVHGRDYTCRR